MVSGYVRCPKCQTPLPQTKRAPLAAGGTAVDTGGGFPIVPVVVGLAVVVGIVVAVMVGRGGKDEVVKSARPADVVAPAPASTPTGSPSTVEPAPPAGPTAPSAPDASELAAILDRDLKKQRLWGTVEVIGARIDVRSGGCEDPAMAPVLDAQLQALRGAGLTKLRCLEQSGRVVFERDL